MVLVVRVVSPTFSSMLGKVKDVGSSVSGVANARTGAVDTLTSLGDIDLTGVLASSGRCGNLMDPEWVCTNC